MIASDVNVYGVPLLRRTLLKEGERLGNQAPAFREVASLLRSVASRQFESEGAYGNDSWEPLRPSTLRAKRARGLDNGILRATYRLERSLTQEGGEHVEEIGRDFLRWGSNVGYGAFHMRGTRRMPRRRPIRLPERDKRAVVKILQRSIIGR